MRGWFVNVLNKLVAFLMLMMFLLIRGAYYLIYRAIIKIIREIKKSKTTAPLIRVNRTPERSIFRRLPEKQRPQSAVNLHPGNETGLEQQRPNPPSTVLQGGRYSEGSPNSRPPTRRVLQPIRREPLQGSRRNTRQFRQLAAEVVPADERGSVAVWDESQ